MLDQNILEQNNMKKRFYDLKEGDIVYGVYDKYHNNNDNSEFVIIPCKVLVNEETERELMSSSDRYDTSTYTIKEHYIEIEFNGNKYYRHYDDFYNERGYMTISSNKFLVNPLLEIFIKEEDAKDYLKTMCKSRIDYLTKLIEQYTNQVNTLENCLKIYK